MSDSAIIGQAHGRKIHAREVVAIEEAGDGLCWVRLTRFGDRWLLIRSDARDVVARGAAAPPDTGGRAVGSVPGGRAVSLLLYFGFGALAAAVILGLSTDVRAAARRMFPRRRQ